MRTGVDAQTGAMLTGWDHVIQSLGKIVRTRVGTRVIRRHLGSDVPDLQDANASPLTLMQLYGAIAEAIEDQQDGEPGFALDTIELATGGRDGRFVFIITGTYFPRGHLGDFSLREDQRAVIAASTGARLDLREVAA